MKTLLLLALLGLASCATAPYGEEAEISGEPKDCTEYVPMSGDPMQDFGYALGSALAGGPRCRQIPVYIPPHTQEPPESTTTRCRPSTFGDGGFDCTTQ